MSKEIEKKIEEENNWGDLAGVEISIGTKFHAGIPFFVGGEVSMEIGGTYEHTWGGSTKKEKTFKTTITGQAPPNSTVTFTY